MGKADLDSAVARRLLSSTIPARLAFVTPDGGANVIPIWFLWRDGRLLMCSQAGGHKVRAMERNPRIAVTIDSETPPYESVRMRGRAEIELVEGIAPEYVACAHRYYGVEKGDAWIGFVRPFTRQMAVISLSPEWVEVWDFRERFPELFGP